ncbi:MAG: chalcone isomerase family protein, partial [Candidatus Sulfotelmatobacter sp.]
MSHSAAQGVLIRKIPTSLVVAVIALACMLNLYGASLAGVTLPDTVQVGGAALVLNGLGLRTKFMVKVYVAGLYLPQKSSDPGAIIKADAPKRIVMQFLRSVSRNQMADAFEESFDNNTPDAKRTMKADIDQFLGALEPLKESD